MPPRVLAGTTSELEVRLRDAKKACSAASRALKKARLQEKELRRRSSYGEAVALNILCQSDGNKIMAKDFLRLYLVDHTDAEVEKSYTAAVTTYDGMPADERLDLQEPTAPGHSTTATRRATRFIKEFNLSRWIHDRNINEGIAPVSSVVAERAVSSGCISARAESTKTNTQKQWLKRFRKRWGIVVGRIPPREQVPPEERCRKACLVLRIAAGRCQASAVGSLLITEDSNKRGHYMASISGPQTRTYT